MERFQARRTEPRASQGGAGVMSGLSKSPPKPEMAWVAPPILERTVKVEDRLLLDARRAGAEPWVSLPRWRQVPLLVVARQGRHPTPPVVPLLQGEVPYEPGVSAPLRHGRRLVGRRGHPIAMRHLVYVYHMPTDTDDWPTYEDDGMEIALCQHHYDEIAR